MTDDELQKLPEAARVLITNLRTELGEAHAELNKTNADLMQMTVELDDRVEQRTAELRESERFTQNTLDALYLEVAVLDGDGNILKTNRTWKDFAAKNGLKRELAGAGLNYLTVCERAAAEGDTLASQSATLLQDIIAGRVASGSFEYPCHSPQEEHWFLCHFSRFAGSDSVRILVVHEEITQRKKAEAVIEQSEANIRRIFQNMQIGVVIHNPDTTIDFSNQKAEQLLSLTKDQLRGKKASDSDWHFIHEDGTRMPETDYPVNQALHGRGDFEEGLILGINRPDQESPTWVLCHGNTIQNKDGHVQQVCVSFLDITERKKNEELIRLQSSALEAAANAIVITNGKGVIEWANSAFANVTGYSTSEVVGKNPRLLNSGKHDGAFYRKLWETITSGEVWHGEITNRRKDGTLFEEDMTITPIKNPKGVIEHFIAVKQDITERKKLEAQFMRAQRMESIGTLAGGVAHDLNNILAPIMMSIDILKSMSEKPEASKILETIEVSAQRGADIVRQVLSFARGLEGQRIEVQPKHLLKDLQNIIKDTFPKDIRLQFTIPNNTWTILGDPTQIHQILLNLSVNARDAMPNGGNLTISAENCVLDEQYAAMNLQAKPGRYVNITVTDSGTGIPPSIIDKIFDPFFTTKDLNKGTGLGLSTVMAVVKSHSGIINVYSEPGKGTTFKVYLPAMESSSEARKDQLEEANLPRGNGETVLVVDDEDSILVITSQTLQAFGYRVLTASDGADAVGIYAQKRDEIAVVLTDMMMPIMDGAALIHALMRMNPSVKIIAASGLNANGNAIKATEAGIKHFLTKPYTARTLLKTMRAILDET